MTRRLTQATYEFFDPQDKCEEAEAGRVKYLYSWRLGFGGSLIYFDHQTVQEVDLGWFADVDEAEGFRHAAPAARPSG